MRRRVFRVALLLCCALVPLSGGAAHPQAQRQPDRLIVQNATRAAVNVEVQRDQDGSWLWINLATVGPSSSEPIYGVRQGEQLRAFLPTMRQYRYHTASFRYDPNYGGNQDWWTVHE